VPPWRDDERVKLPSRAQKTQVAIAAAKTSLHLSLGELEAQVFIKKLKPDERAPETADRVYIERAADGRISWNGTVDVAGKAVSGVSSLDFATVQEAETDAIAWARENGVTELQIQGPNA
jgi:hypothetical protein